MVSYFYYTNLDHLVIEIDWVTFKHIQQFDIDHWKCISEKKRRHPSLGVSSIIQNNEKFLQEVVIATTVDVWPESIQSEWVVMVEEKKKGTHLAVHDFGAHLFSLSLDPVVGECHGSYFQFSNHLWS